MSLRRPAVTAVVLLLFALSGVAQVKVVGPTAITVTVTGNDASATFFHDGPTATIEVSPVGPLQFGKEITIARGRGPSGTVAETITVKPGNKLPWGASHTGTIVIKAADGKLTDIPLTITRPAPTLTAEPVTADVCLECATDDVFSIRIKNTGGTRIPTVAVLPVTLADASRHHRWLFCSDTTGTTDRAGTDTTGTTPPEPKRKPRSFTINLDPGQSTVLDIPFERPFHAGDYAGTIEIQAPGAADSVKLNATIRARGPAGSIWAALLFVLIVLLGAFLSRNFERYYGSGQEQVRDTALLSLADSNRDLLGIQAWLVDWQKGGSQNLFPLTMTRMAIDVGNLERILANSGTVDPAHLKEKAVEFATVVEKWRLFRNYLELASKFLPKKDDVSNLLDGVPETGTVEEYRQALEAQIKSISKATIRAAAVTAARTALQSFEDKIAKRIKRYRLVRLGVLSLVSLASAYLILFHGKCSFGSWPDYITTFFWSLGLTGAGNAILSEGKSQYKPEG